MRARPILSVVGAITLGTTAAVVGVGGSPAAYAAAGIACNSISTATSGTGTTLDKALPDPFAQLRIQDAQQALPPRVRPGEAVTVAVIDTGIDANGMSSTPVPLARETQVTPPDYFHGTTVAGLIAGKADGDSNRGGIAPGVTLLDLPVMKEPSENQPPTPDPTAVTRALDYLLTRPRGERLIVNMSFHTMNTPQIKSAVGRLIKRGAIVVAAGGNRTSDDAAASASASPYVGTENHDNDLFPADYQGVVAVGASNTAGVTSQYGDPDPTQAVLANSQIDVAAPTEGARSWTLNGKSCVINDVATSWSTAIVSGVLALVWSAYPHDTNTAIVDRLERTASGRTDQRGLFTGAGIIQPYDAVTRTLGPTETLKPAAVPPAQVAPPHEDVLQGIRHDAQWWGLIGGGALILALILRPLLSRRR